MIFILLLIPNKFKLFQFLLPLALNRSESLFLSKLFNLSKKKCPLIKSLDFSNLFELLLNNLYLLSVKNDILFLALRLISKFGFDFDALLFFVLINLYIFSSKIFISFLFNSIV